MAKQAGNSGYQRLLEDLPFAIVRIRFAIRTYSPKKSSSPPIAENPRKIKKHNTAPFFNKKQRYTLTQMQPANNVESIDNTFFTFLQLAVMSHLFKVVYVIFNTSKKTTIFYI